MNTIPRIGVTLAILIGVIALHAQMKKLGGQLISNTIKTFCDTVKWSTVVFRLFLW